MGDSTFRYSPGAPGVRDGGTRPGNRGAGSVIAGDPASAGGGRALRFLGVARRRRFAPAAGLGLALRIPAGREPAGERVSTALVHADGVRAAPAVTYWRRRFVVLAVCLATLATAAWSLSEALKVQPTLAGHASTGHGPSAGAAPPQGGGSRAGAAAGTRQGPGGASGAPAGVTTKASRRPVSRRNPKPSPSPGAFGGFKPKFCSWRSIVLSASGDQVDFAPGQLPTFNLSVVSTQPADCSFNVGSRHLALVIKEGPARIWSSADCAPGTRSLVTALRRGVPTIVAVGWNEKTSAPGCNGPARPVPAGTYTAYAVEGSLVSSPVTFRLR